MPMENYGEFKHDHVSLYLICVTMHYSPGVHTEARHSGMCIPGARSTRCLACIMFELTPQCGMGLQYQPSDSWQALECREREFVYI